MSRNTVKIVESTHKHNMIHYLKVAVETSGSVSFRIRHLWPPSLTHIRF